jgi:hypothetical protein
LWNTNLVKNHPDSISEKALLRRRAFVFEQPFLAPQTAGISGERTVGADDTMAGNHNPQWVFTVGRSHGANGLDIAEFLVMSI